MKIALITGANKGIGFETAKQLAQRDCFVYLGSRDKIKGEGAIERLKSLGITNVELVEIDVTNLGSIMAARKELEGKTYKLDILDKQCGHSGETATEYVRWVHGEFKKSI